MYGCTALCSSSCWMTVKLGWVGRCCEHSDLSLPLAVLPIESIMCYQYRSLIGDNAGRKHKSECSQQYPTQDFA